MFKLLAFLALLLVSYILVLKLVPASVLVLGFMIGGAAGTFIAYWWCAFAAYTIVAYRAIF